MRGKGRQFVPHGGRVHMAFPGGGGYGAVAERARDSVERDLALGYISEEVARDVYGLSPERIAQVLASARLGELPG